MWEYTGRVRRGYFTRGLSGVQFIRDKDFAGTIQELEQPRDEIIWLSAVDPVQPWGKSLSHLQDRSFLNVPGTAVALRSGVPVAVFERQGKVLRVFEDTLLSDAMRIFVHDYASKHIFSTVNRLMVKQYPHEAIDALTSAGFLREMQDYVLYRGYSFK